MISFNHNFIYALNIVNLLRNYTTPWSIEILNFWMIFLRTPSVKFHSFIPVAFFETVPIYEFRFNITISHIVNLLQKKSIPLILWNLKLQLLVKSCHFFIPVAFNEKAGKGKQMLPGGSKTRSSLQAGYFNDKYHRVMEGESYSDPIKIRRQHRLKESQRNIGKPFLPSNGEKQM